MHIIHISGCNHVSNASPEWLPVKILGDNCGNKLRSYKYYIYAREMPFYGQIIQLFCLIQKPFKLIFCLRQHLEAYFIQSLEIVVFFTSSVGSSIKVSVFISTVRPCKIPTLKSCFKKGKKVQTHLQHLMGIFSFIWYVR